MIFADILAAFDVAPQVHMLNEAFDADIWDAAWFLDDISDRIPDGDYLRMVDNLRDYHQAIRMYERRPHAARFRYVRMRRRAHIPFTTLYQSS